MHVQPRRQPVVLPFRLLTGSGGGGVGALGGGQRCCVLLLLTAPLAGGAAGGCSGLFEMRPLLGVGEGPGTGGGGRRLGLLSRATQWGLLLLLFI